MINLLAEKDKIILNLKGQLQLLSEELKLVKEQNQNLRDEVARLKGEKGKPDIKKTVGLEGRTDKSEENW
jgi:hypothetical protein